MSIYVNGTLTVSRSLQGGGAKRVPSSPLPLPPHLNFNVFNYENHIIIVVENYCTPSLISYNRMAFKLLSHH